MKRRKDKKAEGTPPDEARTADEQPQDADTPDGADEAPEETVEGLRAERDDLMARLQRTAADYANYQKRIQRDIGEARSFANSELIGQLLGVLDDMERALHAAAENHGQDDPLFTGMQLVHDKALDVLGSFGLEIIDAVGKPFDPEAHSAMMQQPDDEHPPQTVLQELQRGYTLKGRTLRPSAVIVSVEPDAGGGDTAAESQGDTEASETTEQQDTR